MHALPTSFADISLTALPPEERPLLLHALTQGMAWRGLRLRPGIALGTVTAALPGDYAPIPWAEGGYYLEDTSLAGRHPLHAGGAYYMQEPSAMAAAGLLDVLPGHRVLDLCAAPGGKSTQLAARLMGTGVLVSNEYVPSRAKVLSHNIERMGVTNAIVVNEPPERLAERWGAFFDRILVDAPCSGEGMFRREPETMAQWTPKTPAGCALRQGMILREAARLLRPGGLLVYATCTFNEVENEGVIAAFCREHPDFTQEETLRLWPHRVRGEGHFVARLRKEGTLAPPVPTGEAMELGQILPGFEGFTMPGRHLLSGAVHWAVPHPAPPLEGIRVLRMGCRLGEVRRRITLPDHALSHGMNRWPHAHAVDERGAMAYLRGETLPAPGAPKGFTVITHGGIGLGFAKAVDGVLKNHLPKGLRIL